MGGAAGHMAHPFDLPAVRNGKDLIKFFDEALIEFRQTLQIQPEHPQAQNNIGFIFWNLKAYEKSEIEFKKALSINHKLPEIHYNLAVIYLKKNHIADAVFHLKQVLKLQVIQKKLMLILLGLLVNVLILELYID